MSETRQAVVHGGKRAWGNESSSCRPTQSPESFLSLSISSPERINVHGMQRLETHAHLVSQLRDKGSNMHTMSGKGGKEDLQT